jgi:hypothetical protein
LPLLRSQPPALADFWPADPLGSGLLLNRGPILNIPMAAQPETSQSMAERPFHQSQLCESRLLARVSSLQKLTDETGNITAQFRDPEPASF